MDAPEFKRCSVQLLGPQNNVLVGGMCGHELAIPNNTYYTNSRDYAEIVFDAESVYKFPPAVPRKPAYISEATVENVESKVEVQLFTSGEAL